MNYTTGEQNVKARIHNEKDITRDFVLGEANGMWAKCKEQIKARKIRLGDLDKSNELMAEMRRDHKDFCTSYPIVLRYMAEMQTYNSHAFEKYLRKIEMNPWKNEEEYLDSQADYIVILYKETHKRWNTTEVSRLRANIRNILQKEHEQFKKYHAEFEEEVGADEARFAQEKKEELRQYLKNLNGKQIE